MQNKYYAKNQTIPSEDKINDNIKKRGATRDTAAFCLEPPLPVNRMKIEITNSCNHKCIFCAHGKSTRQKRFIDRDLLDRVLREAYSLGVREIGLYQLGEPLLCKNLPEYVSMAKAIGFTYVYIITNGVLATPEIIKPALDAGLDSVQFSINAGSQDNYKMVHGVDDFEKVISNLKWCSGYRETRTYKLFISFLVTKYTELEVDQFRDSFSSLADEILFYYPVNKAGLVPELSDYTYGLKTNRLQENFEIQCVLPFNTVNVSCEGYLVACCNDFNNKLVVGDLNAISLKDAWYGDNMKSVREMFIENNITRPQCMACIKSGGNESVKY